MRYLPTLEFGNQIFQLALPDAHALSLAETFLTRERGERERGLRDILLQSPMLLFWLTESWKSRHQSTNSILLRDSQLVDQLIVELSENLEAVVSDHDSPLSSTHRIEVESFIEIQLFFDIVDLKIGSTTEKIIHRIALMEHVLSGKHSFGESRSLLSLCGTELDASQTLAEFEQTDFSQTTGKPALLEKWLLDLNCFRDGLGVLGEKLRRLEELESEFHELVEKEKLLSMQQLAYGASHEINNPLANISTRAQALLRDETDPKRRQRLQTIDAQAFRAHDMISNLMTFAKPRKPTPTRFQVRPVVEEAVSRLNSLAENQNINIRVECESAAYLNADKDHFVDMIFALVENAMESIRIDGTVKVECSAPSPDSPVIVKVVDDGPGISPETRKHIFDPFYSGREAGRGLGFGLSKVYRLMQLHDGAIHVSEKDGWTQFELQFPLVDSGCTATHNEIEKTA